MARLGEADRLLARAGLIASLGDVSTPIRVVLADDHALVRAGIRQYLERSDAIEVVGEADDGLQAQTVIARRQPDVLLADIKMPGMGGIALTAWVREQGFDTKVLVVSAYDDDPYVTAAIDAGADGYVLKNTSPTDLVAAVRAVHAGQTPLDPTIATKVMRLAGKRGDNDEADLTDRELDVLTLAAEGLTNKEIGGRLSISARTVQGHLGRIFEKLQVGSRTEAVTTGLAKGMISLEPS